MPTTRKQKKARKSRGQDILSNIENFDIVLGGNHFDREESEDIILARMQKSESCNASDNQENLHSNARENRLGNSTEYGKNSTDASSSAELNKLSGELNLRISREMDEMMNSVSVQIQRALKDAISNQILPQIHNAFKAGSGQLTQKGWNVPAERPEYGTEDCRNDRIRCNSKSELMHIDDLSQQSYDEYARS